MIHKEKVPSKEIEKTKQKLKKAAAEVFAKHGFAATSVRMIAKKAKLNVSLISRYFGSKEGLFLSIIEQEIHQLIGSELPYQPMPTLEEELRRYMMSFVKDISDNRRFFRIVIAHSFVDQKFVKNIKQTILLMGDTRLRERLTLLQQNSAIKKTISIKDMELSIAAFLRGIAIYEIILESEPVENLKDHIERFLHVLGELSLSERNGSL